MQLFILRHGDAPYDANDAERALSLRGREETQRVVRARLDELRDVQHIVSSPLRRARETTQAVIETLGYQGKLSFDDCLCNSGGAEDLAKLMNAMEDEVILLVSHQPLVGQMLNYLADETGLGHRMGTSCLASFETLAFSRGAGKLSWLQSP